MRDPKVWIGSPAPLIGMLVALGTVIGVAVAAVGLPYGRLNHQAFAEVIHNGKDTEGMVTVAIDCDPSDIATDEECVVDLTGGPPATVAVAVTIGNELGSDIQLSAFGFTVVNQDDTEIDHILDASPGGTGFTGNPDINGDTATNDAADTIPPPDVTGAAMNCGSPAPGDTGVSPVNQSFAGCNSGAGDGPMVIDSGDHLVLARVYYTVVNVANGDVTPLTLQDVSVFDSTFSEAGSCNPTITLDAHCGTAQFVWGSQQGPTDTPVPTNTNTPLPTNTPVPTNTHTPLPTNTPVPTNTHTPLPTNTHTPVPTNTHTPLPTNTQTPTGTPTTPSSSDFEVLLDCDTVAAGIQDNCNPAAASTLDVNVVLRNNGLAGHTVAAFNFDVIANQTIFDPWACPARLTTAALTGATTLNVDDTRGFPTAGSAVIGGGDVIDWTGKTQTTFTGVTGVTTGYAIGTDIASTGCDGSRNSNPDQSSQMIGTFPCNPPDPDNDMDPSPSVAASRLVCFNSSNPFNGPTIAAGGTLVLARVRYAVMQEGVFGDFSVTNVTVGDAQGIGLMNCGPFAVAPIGNCIGASAAVGEVQGPTDTPTPVPTDTPTPVPPTDTPTSTSTVTNTPLPTDTPIPGATNTPTSTSTSTSTATETNTPAPPTNTPTPTNTSTPTQTPTQTNTPQAGDNTLDADADAGDTTLLVDNVSGLEDGDVIVIGQGLANSEVNKIADIVAQGNDLPTVNGAQTYEITLECPLENDHFAGETIAPTTQLFEGCEVPATATHTPVSCQTATNTPLPTSTNTAVPTSTNTPLPTSTNTSVPTSTNTPESTATAALTKTPASTKTAQVTKTAEATEEAEESVRMAVQDPCVTPSATPTNTATATRTTTPRTNTPEATSTRRASTSTAPASTSTRVSTVLASQGTPSGSGSAAGSRALPNTGQHNDRDAINWTIAVIALVIAGGGMFGVVMLQRRR